MKGLEDYKKELANRISVLVILCVVALLAMLFGNFYLKEQFPLKGNITYYVVGFFTDLEIVSLFFMGTLIRAYRNETALKERYTKERDEREILIRMKSGANIVPLLSMLIVIISLIVADISYEAFIALMAVAFTQMVNSKMIKIYIFTNRG